MLFTSLSRIVVAFIAVAGLSAFAAAQQDAEKEGRDIFERYQAAIGGTENLDRITVIETVSEVEMMGTTKREVRIEDKVGKRSYTSVEGGIEGKQENGFDGKRSWTRSAMFRGYRDTRQVPNESGVYRRLPNETIAGREYLVLDETAPGSAVRSKAYYDPETHLLRHRRITGQIGSVPLDQTVSYSDYGKVGSILVPFTETIVSGATTIIKRRVSIRHNPVIDPRIFEFEPGTKPDLTPENKAETKVDWDKKNPDAVVPAAVAAETFAKVWTKINESYWDANFNGVDWNDVRKRYEGQLGAAKTNQQLNELLNRMVGEIKVSHLRVIPASDVISGTSVVVSRRGYAGLELRYVSAGEMLVVRVRDQSPAAAAGIVPGDIITAVNGESVASIVKKQLDKGGFQLRPEIVAVRAVVSAAGADGKVTMTIRDRKDIVKNVEIVRKEVTATRDVEVRSREISAEVGYIAFSVFLGDLPQKFAAALAPMMNKEALIVDLRGNPGGVGNQTMAIAAMIDDQSRSLGVSQYRFEKTQYPYEGGAKSYKGRLFILVDELTGSSAEILAAGLQAHKRAIVIGSRTAGAVMPSTMELLPNGGALQYVIGDYRTPDGKVLEGRGVIPDVVATPDRKALYDGRDTAIEAAVNLLK